MSATSRSFPDKCEKFYRNVLNKMQFNEDSSSGESTCDESTDIWLTSPTSSQGRSSISSIPWAEDAIKQNQEEWETIEQMFYGELPLPTNKKIREEFEEWMAKFPHIRVVGRQILSLSTYTRMSTDIDREECLAIDPPAFPSAYRPWKQDTYQNSDRDSQMVRPTDLNSEIEQCLRITSGPLLSRRWQHLSGGTRSVFRRHNPSVQHIFTSPAEEGSRSRVASVRSDTFSTHKRHQQLLPMYPEVSSSPLHSPALQLPITLAANLMKIPPILNISNYDPEKYASITARSSSYRRKEEKNLPNRIKLPAITTMPSLRRETTFQTELLGRSISAINQNDPRYNKTATVRYRVPSTASRSNKL